MASLHSNFAAQETSVFSPSVSFPPSFILIKHFVLKTAFQSKILAFIFFRFSPNAEQTDISGHQWHNDATICRNPHDHDKKLFRNGSFCCHSQFAASICPPEAPWLSVWVADKQVG